MLDTSGVCDKLAEAREFAERIGLQQNLEQQLRYLDEYAEHADRGKTRCVLYPDGAPYSFGFILKLRRHDGSHRPWLNGGLLFHGPHDGNGSGAAPTFAVCLQPVAGWAIHT